MYNFVGATIVESSDTTNGGGDDDDIEKFWIRSGLINHFNFFCEK